MDDKVITENDIAAYLLQTPGFFERQADLLSSIQLTSPHGQRAVSLQERQMELLRDKIKNIELHMVNMMRAGGENDKIHANLLEWVFSLLQEKDSANIPALIMKGLQKYFNVPHAALRVWKLDDRLSTTIYAKPVSDDVLTFIKGMGGEPYCGANPDLEVVGWLEESANIRSIALLPLFLDSPFKTFGLIVLGSADERRFTPEMGVDILKSMGAIASAALTRCTKEGAQ